MLNFMALYWPQGVKKKGYQQIWEANLQPLGTNFFRQKKFPKKFPKNPLQGGMPSQFSFTFW
jgi:hypothetical protein